MSIIEGLFPPHTLRAAPPLPNRLSHEPDGLTSVPLEPGECAAPATIQPIHRRQHPRSR